MFSRMVARTIEWGQCDPAGIVFFPRYFEMFDAATASLLAEALGASKADIIERFGIIGFPLVKSDATYFATCSFGEEVVIETSIESVGRTSFSILHRLTRGELLAVEARETRVWAAQRSGRAGDIGGVPIPADVVANFTGTARAAS